MRSLEIGTGFIPAGNFIQGSATDKESLAV
jgi:hypothetical protein